MSAPALQSVFFDMGQTLLQVRTSVGEIYADVARKHGVEVHPRDLHLRFPAAWERSVKRSRQREFRCDDSILLEEWRQIIVDTFPVNVPEVLLARIFEELYEHFSSAEAWRIAPRTHETLDVLRGLGVRVGVLSNWDSRLRRMLQALDLEREFDFLVISHEVGVEKPHPAIFHEALRRAGVPATRALHVGDSLEADILPARELGLRALWIAPSPDGNGALDGVLLAQGLPEDPSGFWGGLVSGNGHARNEDARVARPAARWPERPT